MVGTRIAVLVAAGVLLAGLQLAMAGDLRPIVGTTINQAAAVEQTSLAPAQAADSFTDDSGRTLKLSNFRGKVVLISFWASYCGPCKHELGSLDRLQAMLGGADFVVVPISVEGGNSSISSTYSDYGVSHLGIYKELSDDFPQSMGVSGIPTNIVLGRDGRVMHFSAGPTEWDSPQAIEMIKSFIASSPVPLASAGPASAVTLADSSAN